MSACEKCWRDAHGSHQLYLELLEQRKDKPCSPAEQMYGALIFHPDYGTPNWCDKCSPKNQGYCSCEIACNE